MTRTKFLLILTSMIVALSVSLPAEAWVAYRRYGGWGRAYRRPYGSSGYVSGRYGGSASWSGGSGSATGRYGGSASWGGGSGSISGAYGGSASWNNGSGSVSGRYGGSASWNYRY